MLGRACVLLQREQTQLLVDPRQLHRWLERSGHRVLRDALQLHGCTLEGKTGYIRGVSTLSDLITAIDTYRGAHEK